MFDSFTCDLPLSFGDHKEHRPGPSTPKSPDKRVRLSLLVGATPLRLRLERAYWQRTGQWCRPTRGGEPCRHSRHKHAKRPPSTSSSYHPRPWQGHRGTDVVQRVRRRVIVPRDSPASPLSRLTDSHTNTQHSQAGQPRRLRTHRCTPATPASPAAHANPFDDPG